MILKGNPCSIFQQEFSNKKYLTRLYFDFTPSCFSVTKGKYLIPLHAGAAATHSLRGHSIFARINPFSRP